MLLLILCRCTSYEDNSAITITNIETSYSHLGILSSPLTSEVLP